MGDKDCKIHKLVADVLVLAENKVLFVSYNDIRKYDGQKGWFLPDDTLAFSEHPSDAAKRILREQVGLVSRDVILDHIESLGGEDGSAWHLVFHHKIELDKIPTIKPSTNIKSAEWFALDYLPERDLVAHGGWAIDVIKEILK